jgi:hypothetical protein
VLPAACPSPAAAATPDYPAALPPAASAPDVAKCVYAVKAIIDDLYREYRITLHHFADDGNAAADITVLGLTTAATGPVGTTAKTILSGVATLVGGTKSIINQDLLFQKAIEDVINQMDIDRDTQFNTMLGQMKGTSYSIEQAKADLLEYFAAGTWDHAIVSLQTTVAAKKNDCKVQTDANKVNAAATPSPGAPPTVAAAAAAPPTTGTATPPSATTNNCGPATPAPTTLTSAGVKVGAIFPAATGVGFYQVSIAPRSDSDTITVKFSTSKTNFPKTALPPMPFSAFVRMVTPTPVSSP